MHVLGVLLGIWRCLAASGKLQDIGLMLRSTFDEVGHPVVSIDCHMNIGPQLQESVHGFMLLRYKGTKYANCCILSFLSCRVQHSTQSLLHGVKSGIQTCMWVLVP